MVELTPSGSFCLGWACGVSQSVLLLVDACWSCERSLHTRGAGGPFTHSQRPLSKAGGARCVAESEREETESWQRERRGKSESRWWWWWRIDRWFVNLRDFNRSISPLPSPLWCSRTTRARESEFLPGAHGYNLLLSQTGSLSGSSFLSSTLFTLFTEAGCRDKGCPGGSPVPSLPGNMGLYVPNSAQAAPLQFSSCRWC